MLQVAGLQRFIDIGFFLKKFFLSVFSLRIKLFCLFFKKKSIYLLINRGDLC